MSDTEVAWAAGFFDGEGHVRCSLSGPTQVTVLQIMISQSGSPDLLYRWGRAVGDGKVNGPYFREGRAPCWRLHLQTRDGVLHTKELLWPYLGDVKRQQFTAAVEKYWAGRRAA